MRGTELVCLFVVGLTCGGDAYVHSLYDELELDIDEITEYDQDCYLVLKSNGREVIGHAVGYAGEFTQLVCNGSCIGTGVTPSLSWYQGESSHSGRLIRPLHRRMHTHTQTFSRYSVLTIRNMLQSDKGAYTCRGWLGSVVGWVEKTVYLDYGCLAPRFSCDASRCLDQTSRCDGIRNCRDGFDELHCQESCDYQCDGHCLDNEKWCDDRYDCYDGADERDCAKPDYDNECNESCTVDVVTEEITDCVDQDECVTSISTEVTTPIPEVTTTTVPEVTTTTVPEPTAATGCSSIEYECMSGRCIPLEYTCDGVNDCYDDDDEAGCPTRTTTTPRASPTTTTTRAPPTTTPRCSSIEYECMSGRCIPLAYTCDGVNDCYDDDDEAGCPTPTTATPRASPKTTTRALSSTKSRAQPTTAIPASPTTTSHAQPSTTPQAPSTPTPRAPSSPTPRAPSSPTPRPQQTTSTRVQPTTSSAQPITTPQAQPTTKSRAQPTTKAPPTTTSRAQPTTTPRAQPTTTPRAPPTTISRAQPTTTAPPTTTPRAPPTTTSRAQPTTTQQAPPKTTPRAPQSTTAGACTKKQFDCGDGQCIPVESICDSYPDCQNRADEQENNCGRKLVCQEGQVPCKNQQACINTEFFCDGIAHCSDSSDEESCPQETGRVAVEKGPTSTVVEE